MAVKSKAPRAFTNRTLSVVKTGSVCYYDGQRVIKVRPKCLMTDKGKVYSVPDYVMVRVKL